MSEYEKPPAVEPILPKPISPESRPQPRPQRHSLFWPILLIGAGVLLLMSNLGYFPTEGWVVLWRFWPLALIALGVDVLVGRRSLGGAIAGGILIFLLLGMVLGFAFFADQIPFLIEMGKPAVLEYESVDYPAAGLESASITIDWTSAPGYLSALDDSNNLIEADIAYRGELAFNVDKDGDYAEVVLDSYLQGVSYGNLNFDDREADWDVRLSPDVTLDLWLDASSGRGDYDLRDLRIGHLDLDSGSGSIELVLPESSSFDGKIEAGSGAVTIILPEDVGLRVDLEDGSGSFRYDERFTLVSGDYDDDGVWETKNYDEVDYQINLEIDQGSGSIRIQ